MFGSVAQLCEKRLFKRAHKLICVYQTPRHLEIYIIFSPRWSERILARVHIHLLALLSHLTIRVYLEGAIVDRHPSRIPAALGAVKNLVFEFSNISWKFTLKMGSTKYQYFATFISNQLIPYLLPFEFSDIFFCCKLQQTFWR